MVTQTTEKSKNGKAPDYAPAGRGNFNPFLFLAEGKSAEAALDKVRVEQQKKGGGEITYYDMTLLSDAVGVDQEGNSTSFHEGDAVTLMGSAIINNRMREAALFLMGEEADSEKPVKWAAFEGLRLRLTGQNPVTKKEGKGKGSKMRSLGIEYDRSFKPKA